MTKEAYFRFQNAQSQQLSEGKKGPKKYKDRNLKTKQTKTTP